MNILHEYYMNTYIIESQATQESSDDINKIKM